MPMIDVYAPGDLFPDGVDREIAESLRRSASRRRSTRQLRSVSSCNILKSPQSSTLTRLQLQRLTIGCC